MTTRPPAGASPPRPRAKRALRAPSAVVLAAGTSSRFSGTKQLAEIGGKTLIERVLAAIPAASVGETVVVLGRDSEAVANAIGPRKGTTLVVNADYQSGMGSSIGAGISALAKGAPGALLLLADQPFVTRSLLWRMLREFQKGGAAGIVAAVHGGVVTPPVIFSRRYFRELSDLAGDRGAKAVVERHPRAVRLVRVRSKGTLADIDTRQDLEAARRLLQP